MKLNSTATPSISHPRYEFLRTLNPRQFEELWTRCLKEDLRFDDEVDRMRKERANEQT